ncbi:MAG: GatB/YqeY domain-containing protein, partial [Candidatus Acidiferrales bacterium]
ARHFSKIRFPVILNRGESPNMSLTERIQKELTAAMKEKDELRLSVLRMMKTALKNKEIEKMRPLEDLEALQILQTLVKQRRESVEQFTKGGRDDLAAKEAQEIKIIEGYLPAAPTDTEISRAIDEAVAETDADSLKQMRAVIKAARARLEGKTVDGKVLSDKVRERLS